LALYEACLNIAGYRLKYWKQVALSTIR